MYTFTQFHSTPAIITSVLIGIGILFCGCAMVHNVFVWQKEKTICVRNQNPLNLNLTTNQQPIHQLQHQTHQQQQQTPISTISSPQPVHANMHSHSHHLYQNHNGKIIFYEYPILILMTILSTFFFLQTGIVNQAAHLHLLNHHNNNNNSIHVNHNHTHTSQMSHTTPVTPLSANHSHISYLPGIRPATATPPTPKTHIGNNSVVIGREVSGSVTPGTANGTGTLDISNVTSTISPHELSTLV